MTVAGTLPDSEIVGVQQYDTQDPSVGDAIAVPQAVLQKLMVTSPAFQPKPSAVPPHPQISQVLTAIPLGYQMAFNQLTSPTPYGNTISAYRIYRNKTSNAFSGAQLIRTITHDPTHQGAVTVQDSTGGNVQYYYFVTAVDTTGQESSSPGSFQASATTSGAANPNVLTASSTSSQSTSSASYAAIPNMSITLTTRGNPVLILFVGSFTFTTTATAVQIVVFKDGVQLSQALVFGDLAAANPKLGQLSFLDTPTAGSHTYTIQWAINTGTTANITQRYMQVLELG